MEKRPNKQVQPDTGWAWVVVLGLMVSNFIMGGFIKAFGIFFAAFSEKFDSTASTTSVIAGVRALMYIVFAPLAAILCGKFSEREVLIGSSLLSFSGCLMTAFAANIETVILGTGVLMGAGMSCFFGPVEIAIGRYFVKRKSFAISMSLAGMSLAQIIMPPVNILLMEEYTLTGTLLIYAGLLLNIIVAALLIRPSTKASGQGTTESVSDTTNGVEIDTVLKTEDITKQKETADVFNTEAPIPENMSVIHEQEKQGHHTPPEKGGYEFNYNGLCNVARSIRQHFDFTLLHNPQFTCYLIAYCLASVPFLNIPMYFFPRAEDFYLNGGQSALLLTTMGVAAFVARILLGILGDIQRLGSSFLFTWGVFCLGISCGCVILAKDFLGMAIVAGFLGLFNNTTSTLNMPILVDTLGYEKLPKALALISVMFGIFNSISPPLLGYVKDVTTSYDNVYMVFCVMLVVATALMLIEKTVRTVRLKKKRGLNPAVSSQSTISV